MFIGEPQAKFWRPHRAFSLVCRSWHAMIKTIAFAWIFPFAADAANTTGSEFHGVWRGTIGENQVMVCMRLERSEYYYIRQFWSIPLEQAVSATNMWREGPSDRGSGLWKFNAAVKDSISGIWTDPTGSRSLPIHLSRIAPLREEGEFEYCDPAYDAPRIDPKLIKRGKSERLVSGSYRKIFEFNFGVQGIEILTGGGIGQEQINSTIRSWMSDTRHCYSFLPPKTDQNPGALAEEMGGVDFRMKILFWSERWLSVRNSVLTYCEYWPKASGYRPVSPGEIKFTTWDLKSGQKVSVASWIDKKWISMHDNYLSVSRTLAGEIAKFWTNRQGVCEDTDDEAARKLNYKPVYPRKDGMVFNNEPPDSGHWACVDDILVPWKNLGPFLSVTGKAAMGTFSHSK